MSSYFVQFMARQAELTQSTMAQARKALLEEAESEEAYRKSLMDRQKDLVDLQAELTKKLSSAGKMTDADWKYYFGKKVSLETGRANQQLRTQSELQKLEDDARFDRARLEGLNKEIAFAADKGDVQAVIDIVMGDTAAGIVRGNAQRAKQSGEAAQHDYALALTRFMEQRLTSRADGTMRELKQEERNALQQAAANVAGIRDWHAVNEATVQMMVDSDKAKFNSLISKPHGALLAELERWKDSPGDEAKVTMIKAALATKLAEGGVEEAEIEAQLEALGRPMEVTEEAVRGRTGELMEPYKDISPFPIAAALAKRIQKRRGDKAMADFEDMDENSKIIYQNSLKAQQYLAEFGGQLPPEDQMAGSEWDRARDIMRLVESGELPKTAMVRIAQQFAEKDLGRGAPPTDVRRQRDEIIERVLMLNRVGVWSGESSFKPPPKPDPTLGLGAEALQPVTPPAGAGGGAGIPAAVDQTGPLPSELGVTQAQADAMNPPYIPQYPPDPVLNPPSGSAVADILAPPPEELGFSPLTAEEMGTVSTPAPLGLGAEVAQPVAPPVVAPTGRSAAQAQYKQQLAWKEAARLFSESQTPQDVPGLSTDPAVLAQIAEAAREAGLPLPGWYAALQAQDFFATPVASNP